jgi:tetratricopeptide (TPR) repeat protein
MVETDISAPTSSASPSGSVDRRNVLDLVLAGLICLAAACYWLWDTQSDAALHRPSQSPEPATIAASQPFTNNHSANDDGYRLFLASDYVGAETLFRKAIREDPRGALGFSNLGAALIAQHRFDEAVVALQNAIALDPSLTLARNNLNWALEEKAKHGK